jgi:hypothetical protein
VEVHQPERVRTGDHLGGVAHVGIALGLVRPDLALGKLAREPAQLLLLLRQGEGDARCGALADRDQKNLQPVA